MRIRTLNAGILTIVLFSASFAAAATETTPHIVDPEGDTKHREYGWEEPSLDVTEVTFGWADGLLEISVLLPQAEVLGPEGTMDPFSPGAQMTYVDVYWSMAGAGYLARAFWDPDGEVGFEAGQGPRIYREALWEEGTNIHGDTEPQEGKVTPEGDGHRVTLWVDPAAVGSPAPGDLLEAPAFSSYIDHHFPVFMEAWPVPHPVGPHHPANADLNDAPGLAFHISNQTVGDLAASAQADQTVPFSPGVAAILMLGILVARRRR